MRCLLVILLLSLPSFIEARPVGIPTTDELMATSSVVLIIHPESVRQTTDRPDDGSFGERDLKNYRPLETTCKVITPLKGSVTEKEVKIVHFAYADPKPEFNGGLMMSFLFEPTKFVVHPELADGKPDLERHPPYGSGGPEYLAFLRKLPDGRYAPVTPHYDAATSFRLITPVLGAQRYHHHSGAAPKGSTEPGKPTSLEK